MTTPDMPLHIRSTRADVVESVHRVSAVVVRDDGTLVAQAGDPNLVTFWRSAAKPFQVLPLIQDGAAERWGLSAEDLALASGSHSSEPVHLEVVDRFLAKIGCTEADLACGPHPPFSSAVAADLAAQGRSPTPRWSNCSGKHAGMLALARAHNWPMAGYEADGHPVQDRMAAEVERWTDVDRRTMPRGVDGCGVATFALPLRAMALAYARLGASGDPAVERLRQALWAHPCLVAGTGRLCTEILEAAPGAAFAKIGADGVYGASLLEDRLGIALKVEDGDMRSAPIALLAVWRQLALRGGLEAPLDRWLEILAHHVRRPVTNSRGQVTGFLEAAGTLQFST